MSNRLQHESSPYLLQHAANPVDWYPWSDEALQKSKAEDRPIFLSIGYSACHWCHVMEHESFESLPIAKILNENFVCIKVDREERPDLDQIYMNAVMALRGGGGGWPLSAFLTPDQEVFFGGTYWPPTSRVGMPGFDQVLNSVLDAFRSRRDQVTEQSKKITTWLNSEEGPESESSETRLDDSILPDAIESLKHSFDNQNGGFGDAPKFPQPMNLQFLIRMASQPCRPELGSNDQTEPTKQTDLLELARLSLKKMAYGGIFDHLGGGFARYSVDEQWLVPHFEKMLYDNGLLASAFLEMNRATGDPFFAMIATKTLDYLLNYMADADGGFYSTEDADSEGVEGKFYVWSKQEIIEILGAETGRLFCGLYDVSENGNFEGSNILNMRQSYGDFADQEGIDKRALRDLMREARRTLLKARDQRVRPGLDDKILVSWNALAISAMAQASVALGAPRYLVAATGAARFLKTKLTTDDGRLLHTYRHGIAKLNGYLDDYAYLINALIDLYESDFAVEWLDWAVELADTLNEQFRDRERGGFFFTSADHETLIARSKSYQDGAVPSGNSMAATALWRLGKLTGNAKWLEQSEATVGQAVSLMKRAPLASGQMLIALSMARTPGREYVLVTDNDRDKAAALDIIRSSRPVNSHLISATPGQPASCLSQVLKGKTMCEKQPTLYVCHDFHCDQPLVGLDAIRDHFQEPCPKLQPPSAR